MLPFNFLKKTLFAQQDVEVIKDQKGTRPTEIRGQENILARLFFFFFCKQCSRLLSWGHKTSYSFFVAIIYHFVYIFFRTFEE